jgi:hypothetical protein
MMGFWGDKSQASTTDTPIRRSRCALYASFFGVVSPIARGTSPPRHGERGGKPQDFVIVIPSEARDLLFCMPSDSRFLAPKAFGMTDNIKILRALPVSVVKIAPFARKLLNNKG